MSKIDKKGGFPSKMANADSKYDSFIHFTIKFNSRLFNINFFRNIQFKNCFKNLSLAVLNSTKFLFNEKSQVSLTLGPKFTVILKTIYMGVYLT